LFGFLTQAVKTVLSSTGVGNKVCALSKSASKDKLYPLSLIFCKEITTLRKSVHSLKRGVSFAKKIKFDLKK
jgi:hypothetical protein